MAESLRILILEDNPADAELVQFELEEAGLIFTSKVVMAEKDFDRELQEYCPDLILSDYDLPRYNGALALAEARRRCPDTPFILVTGAVTEDRAIEILTQGAKDYVLKNRLQQRLVPAVRRALAEAEEHRARKHAEAELREAYRTLEEQVEERTSELLESRERLSLALTSSGMGAFEWNIVNNRRYFDDYVYLLLGIKPENFSGTAEEFFQVIHPDDRQAVQDALDKATGQDKPYEPEYRAIWPDGSVHHITSRGKVLRDSAGRSLRMIGVCWEITERKQAEMKLKERTQQLEDANKELESFSYSVSHDLKAPLRAIEGYSRMLMKKYKSKLDDGAARMIDVIHDETEKMGILIDDLLSFSRVLKSRITLSEIDMDKLASEVWNDIRTANMERELEVKITRLLPGFGDRTLIRQVLFNLISNAVKLTKNRAPGSIEMSSYSEPGNVVYCVKDNGVGFDMAYHDKLFGVFQRLHSAGEYEGTGIGLALVQRIIHRHGGRAWAEGEVDKGATFCFTLPNKT